MKQYKILVPTTIRTFLAAAFTISALDQMSSVLLAQSAHNYHAVYIGSLDSLGVNNSYALGINNKSQVVGWSSAPHNEYQGERAFVWVNGAMTDLSQHNYDDSQATSINESGQIACCGSVGLSHNAFIYSDGQQSMIGSSSTVAFAYGINASGQTVGYYVDSNHKRKAFLYSGRDMKDLGTLGGSSSIAYGINDVGQVIGMSYLNGDAVYHAFLYDGSMHDLGTLGESNPNSIAYAINNRGQIVGQVGIDTQARAFLYQNNKMQDIGTLPGGSGAIALGINNHGDIVGNSFVGGIYYAFICSNSTMNDLNPMIDSKSGWLRLNIATGINDKGQIVGVGARLNGSYTSAFLLDPLPIGSLQACANLIPTQQSFGACPIKDSTKDNLIVVTHGWQPNIDNLGFPSPDIKWVNTMSNNIVTYLNSHGLIGWQVFGYSWINNAWTFNPSDALNNAKKEGQQLGNSILKQGWTHIHLIAHSAGAGLIQSATESIKNPTTGKPSVLVHETFLDPFVGADFAGVITYGRGANWADQYFTRDNETKIDPFVSLFQIAPYTESSLLHAYNVDVTYLDPHKTTYLKFGSSPNGAQIEETCSETQSTHSWPIAFYENTIQGNDISNYEGFGFPLSMEGGNFSSTSGYGAGNGTALNPTVKLKTLGTPEPVCKIIGQLSPPLYRNTIPDFTQWPTVHSMTGKIQAFPGYLNLVSGSPAWLATVVTSTNPVNFIAFDAQFSSGMGAQGVLAVLWDTSVIGTLDERVIVPGFQHYQFKFPNAPSYSAHVLGLRLDPFTNIQSAITLTNIVFNQAGVSRIPLLSVTTNSINGLRVMKLDGDAGFNYNIQGSTNITGTNWTDIMILANTNGTVFFYDANFIPDRQMFYRAVAPQ